MSIQATRISNKNVNDDHSIDNSVTENAEKKIIATIFCTDKIECKSIYNIFSKLIDEDFYNDNFRIIFKTASDLYKEGKKLDSLIIASKLKNLLIGTGYSNIYDYFLAITKTLGDVLPSIDLLNTYIEIVKNASKMRKIKKIFKIVDALPSSFDNVNQYILDLQNKLGLIVESDRENNELSLENEINALYEKILRCVKGDNTIAVKSGYESIDQLTGGWKKGNLIIVAARPATGKTTFTINLMLNALKSCKNFNNEKKEVIVFFSLEMEISEILQKIASYYLKIEIDIENARNWSKEKREKILNCLQELKSLPIYIVHKSAMSIDYFGECLKWIKNQGQKVKLMVVDYLQLIHVPQPKYNNNNRYLEVSTACRVLKETAIQWDMPVIVCSQLNRKSEDRKEEIIPKMSDLRDSGTIEQDADLVSFLVRDFNNDRFVSWYLAKHRSGKTGLVQFEFDPKISCFSILPIIDEMIKK